jgi:hypothetical protein
VIWLNGVKITILLSHAIPGSIWFKICWLGICNRMRFLVCTKVCN